VGKLVGECRDKGEKVKFATWNVGSLT
jgi:hypothetical protein